MLLNTIVFLILWTLSWIFGRGLACYGHVFCLQTGTALLCNSAHLGVNQYAQEPNVSSFFHCNTSLKIILGPTKNSMSMFLKFNKNQACTLIFFTFSKNFRHCSKIFQKTSKNSLKTSKKLQKFPEKTPKNVTKHVARLISFL